MLQLHGFALAAQWLGLNFVVKRSMGMQLPQSIEAEVNPFGHVMQAATNLFSRLGKMTVYGFLLAETMVIIIVAQLVIKFVPFRRYCHWLRAMDGQGIAPELLTLRLQRVINLACRILPWEALCLPRAIAAKTMLAWRGYASVLTLGVADVDGAMTAHAWLTASDIIVSGRDGMDRFHELAHFGH
jgi:hypothetical protein